MQILDDEASQLAVQAADARTSAADLAAGAQQAQREQGSKQVTRAYEQMQLDSAGRKFEAAGGYDATKEAAAAKRAEAQAVRQRAQAARSLTPDQVTEMEDALVLAREQAARIADVEQRLAYIQEEITPYAQLVEDAKRGPQGLSNSARRLEQEAKKIESQHPLAKIVRGDRVRQGTAARNVRVAAERGVQDTTEVVADLDQGLGQVKALKAGSQVRLRSIGRSKSAADAMLRSDVQHWGAIENMPERLQDAHRQLAGLTERAQASSQRLRRASAAVRYDEKGLRIKDAGARGVRQGVEVVGDRAPLSEQQSELLTGFINMVDQWDEALKSGGLSGDQIKEANTLIGQQKRRVANLLGMSEASKPGAVADEALHALRVSAEQAQGLRSGTTFAPRQASVSLSAAAKQAAETERELLVANLKYRVVSETEARWKAAQEWAASQGVDITPAVKAEIAQTVLRQQREAVQKAVGNLSKARMRFVDNAIEKGAADKDVVDLVRGIGGAAAEPYHGLVGDLNDAMAKYERTARAAASKRLGPEERTAVMAEAEAAKRELFDVVENARQMLPNVRINSQASRPRSVAEAWRKKLVQVTRLLEEQGRHVKPLQDQVTSILRDELDSTKSLARSLSSMEARVRTLGGARTYASDDVIDALLNSLDGSVLASNPDIAAMRIQALEEAAGTAERFGERIGVMAERFAEADAAYRDLFKLDPEKRALVDEIIGSDDYRSLKATLTDMQSELDAVDTRQYRIAEVDARFGEELGTYRIETQKTGFRSRQTGKRIASSNWDKELERAQEIREIRSRYGAPELLQRYTEYQTRLDDLIGRIAPDAMGRQVLAAKRKRAAQLAGWTRDMNRLDAAASRAEGIISSVGASDAQGALERLAVQLKTAEGTPPMPTVAQKATPQTVTAEQVAAAEAVTAATNQGSTEAARAAEKLAKKATRAQDAASKMHSEAQRAHAAWAAGVKDADEAVARARAAYDSANTLSLDIQDWMNNVAPRLEQMWRDSVAALMDKPHQPGAGIMERLEWAQKVANTSDTIRIAQGNPTAENVAIAKLAADLQTAELDAAADVFLGGISKEMLSQAKRGKLYPRMVEQATEGWVQLERSGLQVPAEVHTALKNLRSPKAEAGFFKMIAPYTMLFKAMATTTPGFHVRNAMSAIFMNLADGVDTRSMGVGLRHMKAYASDPEGWLNGLRGRERQLAEEALEASYATGAGQFADELRGLQNTPGVAGAIANNPVTRKSRDVGARIETAVRYAMAYDTLVKGGSWDQAVARVRRFHFDYTNIGSIDESVKKVVPFWMFFSRNLPLQVQNIWLNPKPYAIYNNFRRNMAMGNDENVPSYIEEQGGFKVGDGMYLSPDLPFVRLGTELERLQDPKRLLADVNPVLRVPAELAAGKQFYNDVPFGKDPIPLEGWEKGLAPAYGAMGQLEDGGVNPQADYALKSLIPFLGQAQRLAPTQERYEERALGSRLRYLGIPLTQVGPDALQREAARRARAGG